MRALVVGAHDPGGLVQEEEEAARVVDGCACAGVPSAPGGAGAAGPGGEWGGGQPGGGNAVRGEGEAKK